MVKEEVRTSNEQGEGVAEVIYHRTQPLVSGFRLISNTSRKEQKSFSSTCTQFKTNSISAVRMARERENKKRSISREVIPSQFPLLESHKSLKL